MRCFSKPFISPIQWKIHLSEIEFLQNCELRTKQRNAKFCVESVLCTLENRRKLSNNGSFEGEEIFRVYTLRGARDHHQRLPLGCAGKLYSGRFEQRWSLKVGDDRGNWATSQRGRPIHVCNTSLPYVMRENIRQCQWKYVEEYPASKDSVYRDQGQVKYKFDVQMQPRDKLDRRLINCRRSLCILLFAEPIPELPILIRRLRKWSGNSSRIFVVWTEATVGRLGQRVNKSLTQT